MKRFHLLLLAAAALTVLSGCAAWHGSGIQEELSIFRALDDVQNYSQLFPQKGKKDKFFSPNPKDYIDADGIATGIPSSYKVGWVISPWAPKRGLVDVRHYKVGQIIVCPYTGKPLRVPNDGDFYPVSP